MCKIPASCTACMSTLELGTGKWVELNQPCIALGPNDFGSADGSLDHMPIGPLFKASAHTYFLITQAILKDK